MRQILLAAIAAAMVFATSALQAQMPASAMPTGVWTNPRGTVKVKTGECGNDLCGWVIWASPQALADAQSSGVDKLIGTELLRNYRATGSRQWQGEVYVPDMGRTFYSRIVQLDPNRLKISGCILGGLLCKSQIWQKG